MIASCANATTAPAPGVPLPFFGITRDSSSKESMRELLAALVLAGLLFGIPCFLSCFCLCRFRHRLCHRLSLSHPDLRAIRDWTASQLSAMAVTATVCVGIPMFTFLLHVPLGSMDDVARWRTPAAVFKCGGCSVWFWVPAIMCFLCFSLPSMAG